MKFPRNAKIFRGQLDLAPLAGIFFLLVIFFLLHSSLVFTAGVRIQLPSSGDSPLPGLAGPSAVVVMDSNGELYFENQVIKLAELQKSLRQLAEKHRDITLVLQADKSVRLESLVQLSRLAAEAGIHDVWLAAQSTNSPESVLWQKTP
jgi:biopolymer transport protein ExbD